MILLQSWAHSVKKNDFQQNSWDFHFLNSIWVTNDQNAGLLQCHCGSKRNFLKKWVSALFLSGGGGWEQSCCLTIFLFIFLQFLDFIQNQNYKVSFWNGSIVTNTQKQKHAQGKAVFLRERSMEWRHNFVGMNTTMPFNSSLYASTRSKLHCNLVRSASLTLSNRTILCCGNHTARN